MMHVASPATPSPNEDQQGCSYSAGNRLEKGKVSETDLTPRLSMDPSSPGFELALAAAVALPFICYALYALVAGQSPPWMVALAVTVLLVAGLAGVALIAREATSDRAAVALEKNPDLPLGDLVREVPFGQLGTVTFPLKSMAKAILRHRGGGFIIRSDRKALSAQFEPMAEAFEPQPIDESSPAFLSLIGGEHEPAARGGFERVGRRAALAGGWSQTSWKVLVCLYFGYLAYRGEMEVLLAVLVFLGLAVCFWLSMRGANEADRQWLAVPGGLIIRRALPFRYSWRIHYVRREESVLLVHKVPNRAWWAVVAFEGGTQETWLTTGEAEFLLRAWLSPVPPPDPDRLSDLL